MLTTQSQGTRIMARDHGGNVEPRATGTILKKCPDCDTALYKPRDPYAQGALVCSNCGHDFLGALIMGNT